MSNMDIKTIKAKIEKMGKKRSNGINNWIKLIKKIR